MKLPLTWQEYQRLEQTQPSTPTATAHLNDFWQVTLAKLWARTRVWQVRNAAGQLAWSAYNPETQRTIRQATASEVRAWLEAQSR